MNSIFLTAAASMTGNTTVDMLIQFAPFVVVLVVMYFFLIRPQKTKEKKVKDMREALEVGDGVTTIGGMVGRVVSIKDDAFVMETGSDRVKVRFKKWAIQDVEKLNIEQ